MKYLFTIFLFGTVLIAEVWRLFPSTSCLWIINPPEDVKAMSMQWNIKFITDQLQFILIGLALVSYKKNYTNRATAKTFLSWYVLDFIHYFYNYKSYHYQFVYVAVAIIFTTALFYEKRNHNRAIAERCGRADNNNNDVLRNAK